MRKHRTIQCVFFLTCHSVRVAVQWGTGQDQMRVIKARMRELVPELQIFLDVDDLEDIANLQGYIERTQVVLVFCSKGYFQSKNVAEALIRTPRTPLACWCQTRIPMLLCHARGEASSV